MIGSATNLVSKCRQSKTRRGFTLVELLAVIGVIFVFVAVIGLALSRGNQTINLQVGQRLLVSAMNLARAQAISSSSHARLIVCNRPNDDRYLRLIGVVTQDPSSSKWRASDAGVTLPKGVYFSPELAGVTLDEIFGPGDWTYSRSKYYGASMDFGAEFPTTEPSTGTDKSANLGGWIAFEFDPTGRPSDQRDNAFLVVSGRPDPNTKVLLENPSNVLGVKVRRYGNITLISDVADMQAAEP